MAVLVGGQTGGAGGDFTSSGGTGGTALEGGWQFETVQIPSSLDVPPRATLKTRLHAMGFQIYACGAAAGASPVWTLKAPEATLYDSTGFPVGKHSLGPTWAHNDGSGLVGAKVAQAESPKADAIPWLLLRAVSNRGTGVLSDISFVQRVNTEMGKAPGSDCAGNVDKEVRVGYSADYYFYTGGNLPVDGAAAASLPFRSIEVPAPLAVPAGAVLKTRVHGEGVQIYTCAVSPASPDGGAPIHAWALKAPEATLYDEQRNTVGTHGQGPSWSAPDGSAMVGTRRAQLDSPDADAIPWLLLGAASHTGAGLFADVTFVQRLNTAKGKAPATGCDAAGEAAQVRVDYTADYYFYTGGDGSAAGGNGS
jgi:hypothetical protein